ncbi:hypothetical protein C8J56DRAFT_1166534 [Mycena floridula]|nr:hypothetical protein C8J56DRAFT_1166534 [Mycena floridula]
MFLPSAFLFEDCPNCGQTTTSGALSDYDELNLAYEAHYLNFFPSNHSLPDDEIIALQEIAALDTRLGELDSRIVAVASLLEALQRHQIEIQRSITLRKGLVSPIRKLPNDVLGDIFIEAHESESSDAFSKLWSPFDMESIPWAVSQVCSRWRQIACKACPSLWSTFQVTTGGSSYDDFGHWSVGFRSSGQEISLKYLPNMVRECLDRSGNHALTFTAELGTSKDKEIIVALADHCERWREVTWSGYGRDPPLDRIKGRLPLLEIFRWKGFTRDGLPLDNAIFTVAPRLRTLEIPLFCQLSFPWLQLQYLQIHNVSEDQQQDIFDVRRCTNLVECHILYSDFSTPSSAEPPIFSRLRILQCYVSSLETFVNSPVLEELKLVDGLQFTTPSIIGQMASKLETVTFHIPPTNEDMHLAVAVLNSLSNVTTLNLGYSRRDPSILPLIEALYLSPTRQEKPLMSRLQRLTLPETNHILQSIVMFQSRLPALQSLQIGGRHSRPAGLSEELLQELQKQGLDITWK